MALATDCAVCQTDTS